MNYEAATWLLVAKGDAYLAMGDVQSASGMFGTARLCHKGNNPYIVLKEGVCQFRLGEISRSLQTLTRAFISEGAKIFEEGDPRLLQFSSLHLKAPAGQMTLVPGVNPPISSAEEGRELGDRFVAELSRRVLERLAEFGADKPAAALVIGYNHPVIADVPLLGIRGADRPDTWMPNDYVNFAHDEVQLYDRGLADAAMKMALVSDENHPPSRELYIATARVVRERAPRVSRVTEDFVAYPSDFSGRDLKKNQVALGMASVGPGKGKSRR